MNSEKKRRTDLEIEYLLLRLLSQAKNLSLREICESLDLHPKTARKHLKQFEARSMAKEKPMGESFFYTLKTSNEEDRRRNFEFLIQTIGRERAMELDLLYGLKSIVQA